MKTHITFLLTFAILASTPSILSAQEDSSAENDKIQRFFNKLNRMTNAASRPDPVTTLAKKLVRLDPANAKRYYKTATIKYIPLYAVNKTDQLAKIYYRLLQKAADKGQISQAKAKQLIRVIKKIKGRADPTPTPTPYQA